MISGIQKLDGDVPIKGYGFGYTFDAIANRTSSAADGASGQRQTTYVANQVNQYSSITSPGFEHLIGSAAANATVTGNWTPEGNPPPALQPSDIVQAIRQGNRWYLELGADNGPGPVCRTATIRGIVREGADSGAKDAVQELQRSLFIPAATQSLSYDTDGNMLSDGRWDHSWDGNNRLLSVESVAATPDARKRKVEYSYDYMGRIVQRIERSEFNGTSYATSITTRIVYDGWNPILELDASGAVLKRYYWGLDLSGSLTGAGGLGGLLWMEDVRASKAYGYCYDGNGNVVGLVDLADGSLAANYEYGPFGEPLATTGPAANINPFRFSTKRTDPVTGLVYYGYRHYHPELGRWISRDPIGEKGGANTSVLVDTSPLNTTDYLGLKFLLTIKTASSRPYPDKPLKFGSVAPPDYRPRGAHILWSSLDTVTIMTAEETDVLVTMTVWTGGHFIHYGYTLTGYQALWDHEYRHVEIYKRGYEEYIAKAQGPFVEGRSLCGPCAESKLRSWLNRMREAAKSQYETDYVRNHKLIEKEDIQDWEWKKSEDEWLWLFLGFKSTYDINSHPPRPFIPVPFPRSGYCGSN